MNVTMKFRLLFVALFFLCLCTQAQRMQQLNAAEIRQGLEALQVTGSVLYIAAHPDDENTRLLTYLAREKKLRTGYLSLTRGDGGQNLIGNEQAELLGLIRTQELLAARRIDGAEQFFTRANDFGFSKNPEESFRIWEKGKILGDVVWVIRNFRPDVIITRFPEDSRAGHGHHSGSAILAREAFTAAGDPKQFPEQLAFVKPWQAKRIVWNTFNFGGNNTTSEDQLKIDVGLYNPLFGKSYGELAAESRSSHRSQGFGSAMQRGSGYEYFTPVAGAEAKGDLFSDIDLTLGRLSKGAAVQKLLAEITRNYDVADPSKSIPKLLELKVMVNDLPFKHQALDDLILSCAGIWLESAALNQTYALGEEVDVRVQAIVRPGSGFSLPVEVTEVLSGASFNLKPNVLASQDRSIAPKDIAITQPYWLEQKHGIGTFNVDDLHKIGMAENKPAVAALFKIRVGDHVIEKSLPVVYKYTDQVKGEIYQPLVIAPPVTATLSEKAFIFNGNAEKKVVATLRGFKENVSGMIRPVVPTGWKVSPEQLQFTLGRKGEERNVEFTVTPAGSVASGTLSLKVVVDGKTYDKGLHEINYDHIPAQTLFPLAAANVNRVSLVVGGKRIGYIAGAGDLIPESLRQIGYQVELLNANQVITQDLSKFDAIVTGVRLYNVSDQARVMQPKLMNYVENGGTLLVQYNVNAPLRIDNMGPYPFRLSRDRVTEEDAAVTFLAPQHPVLNVPNKITKDDFNGWVQERGLYFVTDTDQRYTPLFSMHDAGEPARNGSLIVADYGKGRYIYTGISFFRQLPAGVPGAYRLFVNLISRRN